MSDHTDALLIQKIQDGNEEAFNELYEKYYRLVYFIAYEMCHNDADAKDILQDTFVQVKHSIHTLQDKENFKPWLNRITVNKCKNMFRSNRSVEMDHHDLWYQLHINEDRSYMLPEKNMHKKNDEDIIHEMLSHLSIQQREVLIMRYFEHMSMKEMAEVLDVPEGTIKTRLMYGKKHLKEMILAYEKETGTKIDFHVEDASLVLLFAYLYKQGVKYPSVTKPKVKKLRDLPVSDYSLIGAMLLLSMVFVTSSMMAVQTLWNVGNRNTSEDQKVYTTQIKKSDAREYYFYLMDWACCRDDMLVKSKEDFEAIMPIYEQMINTPSQYLERLKEEHWISDFEEIYKNL